MNCPFCTQPSKLSKEHIFSKPICDLFGIDPATVVGSLDGSSGEIAQIARLDQRSVRLPCQDCNNGWMSQLEVEAAALMAKWIKAESTLTEDGVRVIRRWLAKTAIVIAFGEVDARRFMEDPTGTAIPDITTAKAARINGQLDHVVIGAARTATTPYLWGAGNPTVVPSGADRISSRAVNVLVLNLGILQLWAAIPLVQPDRLELPAYVTQVTEGTDFGDLDSAPLGEPTPTAITAFYSDATTEAILGTLDLLGR